MDGKADWKFWKMVAILHVLVFAATYGSVWGFICYYEWLKVN